MNKTENQKNSISFPAGYEPLLDIGKEQIERGLSLIRDRKFLLSNTGITPRVFNQWKKLKLIDIDQLKDSRPSIKLNFKDYIWLKLVKDLRRFGCSLNDIKNIKEECNSSKALEYINKDEIMGLIIKDLKNKNEHSQKELEKIEKKLAEMNWQKELNEAIGMNMNMLEIFVLIMIFNNTDSNLLIFLNENITGLSAGFLNDEIVNALPANERENIYKVPHINLPLRHYLSEFISDFADKDQIVSMNILSEEEKNLMKEVRMGDVDEIKIIFKGGKIERFEVQKEIQKNVEARLIETFRVNEYADITYKVENGVIKSFKKTTKFKFNK